MSVLREWRREKAEARASELLDRALEIQWTACRTWVPGDERLRTFSHLTQQRYSMQYYASARESVEQYYLLEKELGDE